MATAALYAAQTFDNIPSSDGRRIQIGWGTDPTAGDAIQPDDAPANRAHTANDERWSKNV